ncbi:hypothetical protein D3C86_1887840 [compost metagenome]
MGKGGFHERESEFATSASVDAIPCQEAIVASSGGCAADMAGVVAGLLCAPG